MKVGFDRITALSAVFIALIALVFSMVESRRSERFQRLALMPLVGIDPRFNSSDGFVFSIVNATDNHGIVKWWSFKIDGEEIEDYDDIYRMAGIGDMPGYSFGMVWPETVVRENENFDFLTEKRLEQARKLWKARSSVEVQLCICSVLRDCAIVSHPPIVEKPDDTCHAEKIYEAKFHLPKSFKP